MVDIDSRNFTASFTATGSGNTLTVDSAAFTGTIHAGDLISGTGIPGTTFFCYQISGTPGGPGVYHTNNATTATSAGGTLTSGTFNGCTFSLYITVDVGGRGATPLFTSLSAPYTYLGQGYLYSSTGGGPRPPFSTGASQVLTYRKDLIGYVDSGGSPHYGLFICTGSGNNNSQAFRCTVQVEYIAALINELEAMIIAQGKQNTHGPINPWVCVWDDVMLSTDSDYQESDNIAINTISTLLNGNSSLTNGAIPGIPARCDIFLEYSNETWNYGYGFYYGSYQSQCRWPGVAARATQTATADWTALRAVQMVQDVRAAFPSLGSRLKPIMNGQWGGTTGQTNGGRVAGNTELLNDSATTAIVPPTSNPVYYGTAYGNTTAPITFFWGYSGAPYLDPTVPYQLPNNGNWQGNTGNWWSGGTHNSGDIVCAGQNGGNFHNYTCNTNGTTTYPPSDATNWTDNGAGNWNASFNPYAPARSGYDSGDYVTGSNYHSYQSLVGSNIGNDPTTDGGVHWKDLGASPYCTALQNWVANGQVSFSTATAAFPSHVTTTTAHGFSVGDLVMMTNFTVSHGSLALNIYTLGYILASNFSSTGFDLQRDFTYYGPLTNGTVTKINGAAQEAVYASYLEWMQSHGTIDINATALVSETNTAALSVYGDIKYVNYEGWEEMIGNLTGWYSSSYNGPGIVGTDDRAFNISCKQSQAMITLMTNYLNAQYDYYNGAMPAVYTYCDSGRWTFVASTSFDQATPATGFAEWSGIFPSWEAMATYNVNAYTKTFKVTTT